MICGTAIPPVGPTPAAPGPSATLKRTNRENAKERKREKEERIPGSLTPRRKGAKEEELRKSQEQVEADRAAMIALPLCALAPLRETSLPKVDLSHFRLFAHSQ
jgi:hypothetical protein